MKRLLLSLILLSAIAAIAAYVRAPYYVVWFILEGDSIMEGTTCAPSDTSSNAWNQAKAFFATRGIILNVTNIAKGGDMFPDLTDNGTYYSARTNLPPADMYYYVLSCGMNNIAINDSVATVSNYLASEISTFRAAYPNDGMIVQTILNNGGAWSETLSNRVIAYNGIIRSNLVGADFILDAAAGGPLSDNNNSTYFCGDFAHPKYEGYRHMATNIYSFLLSNSLVNTTYYVRKDGSDSNLGTTNSSSGGWLTIQKAANSVYPGDRVNIAAGVYGEKVTVRSNGTPTHLIQFIGAGAASVTNWGWTFTGADYTRVADLSCSNSASSANSFALDLDATAMNNVVSNVAVYGNPDWVSRMGGVQVLQGATNNWFERLRLDNPNYHYAVLAGNYTVFTNSMLIGNTGWDVFRIPGSSVRVVGNTISNVNNVGQTSGALIAGVTYGYICSTCDGDFSNRGGGAPGTYANGDSFTATSSGTPTSYGNVELDNANHSDIFQVFGDDPADISTNVTFSGNSITYCTNYQMGILTDDQEDGRIGDWTLANNLWVDVYSTLSVYAPKIKFYHQTFVRCAKLSAMAITIGSSGAGHADNIVIENCIFFECGESPNTTADGWYGGDAVTGAVMDYNLVVGTGAGTTKSGFTEAHGINGSDPLFVSSTNFRLSTNSPALGVGTNLLSLVSTDILGNSRDSTPSLGAYEDAGSGGGGGGSSTTGTTGRRLKFNFQKR